MPISDISVGLICPLIFQVVLTYGVFSLHVLDYMLDTVFEKTFL